MYEEDSAGDIKHYISITPGVRNDHLSMFTETVIFIV